MVMVCKYGPQHVIAGSTILRPTSRGSCAPGIVETKVCITRESFLSVSLSKERLVLNLHINSYGLMGAHDASLRHWLVKG